MFYYVEGILSILNMNTAVVDCQGVGYKLTVSKVTRSSLNAQIGKTVRLYTHLVVREDAMELYGFFDEKEMTAFEQLISVSGIGPKAAISILSALTVEHLNNALLKGDAKAIAQAQGVGAKTAARVVLELKDKLAKALGITADELPAGEVGTGNLSDAQSVLMGLGYTRNEALNALKKVASPEKSTEDLVRDGIRYLSGLK